MLCPIFENCQSRLSAGAGGGKIGRKDKNGRGNAGGLAKEKEAAAFAPRGHTFRVFSQRWMQWKWKAWLHSPHATLQSSGFAVAWFAWHSMPARVGGRG